MFVWCTYNYPNNGIIYLKQHDTFSEDVVEMQLYPLKAYTFLPPPKKVLKNLTKNGHYGNQSKLPVAFCKDFGL